MSRLPLVKHVDRRAPWLILLLHPRRAEPQQVACILPAQAPVRNPGSTLKTRLRSFIQFSRADLSISLDTNQRPNQFNQSSDVYGSRSSFRIMLRMRPLVCALALMAAVVSCLPTSLLEDAKEAQMRTAANKGDACLGNADGKAVPVKGVTINFSVNQGHFSCLSECFLLHLCSALVRHKHVACVMGHARSNHMTYDWMKHDISIEPIRPPSGSIDGMPEKLPTLQ
ncbi:unnamed protein product, partial [Timema podura]|nr:unnamed protein product [Timema podura]